MKLFEPEDHIREFMDGAVGAVEANSFESMCLWASCTKEYGMSWKSEMVGYSMTIGKVGRLPVHVSFSRAEVDGRRILFYNPTSRMVDWTMVKEWLHEHLPPSCWDERTGRARIVDAQNFSNVFPRKSI